jgi:two-component system, OmpR family, catabolic regulation response regulator CreB
MHRILIVEDEPTIAEPLVYALQRDGFSIETVALGQDALTRGGFDVCRSLRRDSDVPVLFLTARGDEIDRIVGLEIGADDYVVKPFSPREVVARIKVILRRRSADSRPAAAPIVGNLQIDRERASARFQGQTLPLTRYEFLLLALLAERPGRVYSRDEILQALWPAASGSMDRTVDTHVKTLRAKIRELAPHADPVRTHRGLGYSLADIP